MRIINTRKENNSLLLILVVIFTLGVVLGAVSFFGMDNEILNEVHIGVNNTYSKTDFWAVFKKSFTVEIIWVGLAFLIGQIGFLVPFSCGVLAVRGFVLGFTVSFIFSAGDNILKILIKAIVPQCLLAIPLLTLVTVLNTSNYLESRKGTSNRWGSVLIIIIAVLGATLVAVAETSVTMFL